jgi:hypothetical protein
LRGSELKLFKRTGDDPCCNGAVVATVKTHRFGGFDFKGVPTGSYWLTTNLDGRDVQMPIEFKTSKPTSTQCSDQFFNIDENYNFGLALQITVD